MGVSKNTSADFDDPIFISLVVCMFILFNKNEHGQYWSSLFPWDGWNHSIGLGILLGLVLLEIVRPKREFVLKVNVTLMCIRVGRI